MPRLERASIQDLLDLSKIEEVVAHFGELGNRGANRNAACPKCDADRKSRKFSVSVPKQLCHCFECGFGAKGALGYLMKGRDMAYLDAVKWLADFYHFSLREEVLATMVPAPDGTTVDRSYFDQRMAEMAYRETEGWEGLFTLSDTGGIAIKYPALDHVQGTGNWQQANGQAFTRERLHPTRCTSGRKYVQAKDTGIRVFVPPPVVALYRAGQQFDALYVVEGEFKAYVMANAGVPIVGIGGKDMFHRGKGENELHPDLMKLLATGRCKSIVLVLDADVMQVTWDPDAEPEKDLGKKLKSNAGTVTRFRLAAGKLVPHVCFTWHKPEFATTAKGIDDLAAMKGADEVATQLQQLRSTTLFYCRDISSAQWREINGCFDLNIHGGVPKAFYSANATLIGDRSFVWCGGTYRFVLDDEAMDGGRLVMERHPDSKLFIRVGCEHYKQLWKYNEFNKAVPYRKLWKDTYLTRDYVNKGAPNFLDTIAAYDDFVIDPGHFEHYRNIVEVNGSVLFNKYYPLDHTPKQGSIDHIVAYLQHAFGTHTVESRDGGKVVATSENWQVYMDRMKLMLRHPRLKLPAVVLGSEERNTGKSTLLAFERALWQSNAVIIPNEAITDQFNSDWANALNIGINEALIEKKRDQERLKTLIVDLSGSKRGMYAEREQTPNFVKISITTNDLDTFIQIAPDEFRYWINRVPPLKHDDPDQLDKMIAEIPALLHVLRTEPVIHPKLSRLWFANSVIDTEARRNVAKQSRSWCEGEIREWLRDQFNHYQWPELAFQVHQVHKAINTDNGARFRRGEVSRVLQKVMKMDEHHQSVLVPFDPEKRAQEQKCGEKVKRRWYVFCAADFVGADEAAELHRIALADWSNGTDKISDVGEYEALPLLYPDKVPQPEPA